MSITRRGVTTLNASIGWDLLRHGDLWQHRERQEDQDRGPVESHWRHNGTPEWFLHHQWGGDCLFPFQVNMTFIIIITAIVWQLKATMFRVIMCFYFRLVGSFRLDRLVAFVRTKFQKNFVETETTWGPDVLLPIQNFCMSKWVSQIKITCIFPFKYLC